jgi:hypothetical protein
MVLHFYIFSASLVPKYDISVDVTEWENTPAYYNTVMSVAMKSFMIQTLGPVL